MRLMKRFTLLPALLFMVVSAYGQKVQYRSANFASYKTYQWVEIPGGAVSDQLIDQAIKWAVDEKLAKKGLTRVERCADLYIGYQATIEQQNNVELARRGTSRWWSADILPSETSILRIEALLVNLFDPRIKHLIWRGGVSKTIELNKNPAKNYRALQKAMAKLFKNYPPQPNK